MTSQDYRSQQTERAALIKARFGFDLARDMLGMTRRSAGDICPSCRAAGVVFLSAATVPSAMGAMLLPTDDLSTARTFRCGHCPARGDAADYVAAAKGWTEAAAVSAIEAFIEGGFARPALRPSPPLPPALPRALPFKALKQTRREMTFGKRIK